MIIIRLSTGWLVRLENKLRNIYYSDLEKIKEFRNILGEFPLIVGAGMTDEVAAEQLKYSDGGIVGSFFKTRGIAHNYMEEDRIVRFMNVVKQIT